MGKKRTEKSKYPSRYSPQGFVHGAQYVTELICEKKAKVEKKELPLKFWDLPDWNKYYKYQIMLANRLVKKYGESAVIATLNDKRTWKTYSLRAPLLVPILEEYKEKSELAKTISKGLEYDFSKKETFNSNNSKKSIISKLRDLDD